MFAVELSGLRRADPLPAAPSLAVARLVAEDEIEAALESLAAAPAASPEALWRIDLLARAGRLDEAADHLRSSLAGLPEDHPFHARLSQRLMRDPDNFLLAAKRALGPALYDIFLDPGRNEILWRPARNPSSPRRPRRPPARATRARRTGSPPPPPQRPAAARARLATRRSRRPVGARP
ncbi:hypothetical protein [Nannocystis pusilla]|uniref:hypothetical protein n=1 Tax=Nannocystis pusilla TaxID=889268 RepID=UPI003DA26362